MATQREKSFAIWAARVDTLVTVGIEELLGYKEMWNTLAGTMRYPTVFCTWEWMYAWWEHFGEGREPYFLMMYRDGKLKGILPLFMQRRFLGSGARVGRVLGYCGANDLRPDPLDVISAESDADECIEMGLNYLRRNAHDWDVLRLQFLSEDSHLLKRVSHVYGSAARTKQVSAAPYVSVTGTYDGYLSGLSRNERSNIRRHRRKLIDEQGVVYFDLGSEGVQPGLELLFELHKKRAAEKNIRSSFAREDVFAFHRNFLDRLSPDQVWLRGLRKGSEVIAAYYGFVAGGRIFYYQSGYNPEWTAFSPGSVLLQETIREAFERGFTEYNFLQGREGFKYRWSNQSRRLYTTDIFNSSLCGRLSRWMTDLQRVLMNQNRQIEPVAVK